MEHFLTIEEYKTHVLKYLRKRAPALLLDDDAIAYIMYWAMRADQRFDETKNDSRDGHRALYIIGATRKWFRALKSANRNKIEQTPLEYIDIRNILGSRKHYIESPLKRMIKKEELTQILSSTSGRKKDIVMMYYLDGMSYSEIGTKLNISKQRVQQILSEELNRLRGIYGTKED